MLRRKLIQTVVVLAAIAGAATLCVFAWKLREEKRAEARDRYLRQCHPQACGTPTSCAVNCARQFLERNGWLEPKLGKPEEAVLEFRDNVDFKSMAAIVSSRARVFKPNPSMVCTESDGYMVAFPYPDRPAWESGAVMMAKDFSRLRVSHEQFVFKGLPAGCTWTEWAQR